MNKLIFCLLACLCLSITAEGQASKIKVGVSTPLTGDAAVYGLDNRRVLTFLNDKIYNHRYEFIFEDDKCSGKDAVTAAHKLVTIDKVKYVIGFACSGALLSAAPVYEKGQVITIGIQTTSPAISKAGAYVFRTSPSDEVGAKVLGNFLAKSHKHIAVVSEETDYCEDLLKGIQNIKALNLEVERYKSGETDFRSQLLKLKSKTPEAILFLTQSDGPLINLVRQSNLLHFDVPVYSAYYPSSANFLKGVGDLANGVTFVDLPTSLDSLSVEHKKLYEEFIRDGGPLQAMDYEFVLVYNALAALDAAGKSGNPLNSLYSDSFTGASGPFSFDDNGDIVGVTQIMKRIVAGKPSIVH